MSAELAQLLGVGIALAGLMLGLQVRRTSGVMRVMRKWTSGWMGWTS